MRSFLFLVAVACASAFVPVVPLHATAPSCTRTTDVQMIVRLSLVHRPCSILAAVLLTSPLIPKAPPQPMAAVVAPIYFFVPQTLLSHLLVDHPPDAHSLPRLLYLRSVMETSSRSSTGLLTSARLCSAR